MSRAERRRQQIKLKKEHRLGFKIFYDNSDFVYTGGRARNLQFVLYKSDVNKQQASKVLNFLRRRDVRPNQGIESGGRRYRCTHKVSFDELQKLGPGPSDKLSMEIFKKKFGLQRSQFLVIRLVTNWDVLREELKNMKHSTPFTDYLKEHFYPDLK